MTAAPRRRASRLPGRSSASHGERSSRERLEQQHLGRPAGVAPQSQPGRDHPGLVQHEQIARRGAGPGGRARGGARAPPSHGRPADGPLSRGSIGVWAIAIVGQLVVEVGDLHRPRGYGRPGRSSGPVPRRPSAHGGQSNRPALPAAGGAAQADVLVGGVERDAPTWRAGDHPLGDQERLVHVLDRLGLLTDADRHRRQPDRTAVELGAQRGEDRPVDLVEAAIVDAEQRQPVAGDVGVDRPVGADLGEVAHPAQQPVGDTRRAARPAGDLPRAVTIDRRRRGCRRPARRSPAARRCRSSRAGPRARSDRAAGR